MRGAKVGPTWISWDFPDNVGDDVNWGVTKKYIFFVVYMWSYYIITQLYEGFQYAIVRTYKMGPVTSYQ